MRPAEESTRKVSVPGLKVAAFGPFGSFEVNPSLTLARRVFEDVEELEVAFAFVDAWLDRIRDEDWTALLVIGVDGKAEALRLETLGRNVVAALPDVRGEVRGPGKIDPLAPDA